MVAKESASEAEINTSYKTLTNFVNGYQPILIAGARNRRPEDLPVRGLSLLRELRQVSREAVPAHWLEPSRDAAAQSALALCSRRHYCRSAYARQYQPEREAATARAQCQCVAVDTR